MQYTPKIHTQVNTFVMPYLTSLPSHTSTFPAEMLVLMKQWELLFWGGGKEISLLINKTKQQEKAYRKMKGFLRCAPSYCTSFTGLPHGHRVQQHELLELQGAANI